MLSHAALGPSGQWWFLPLGFWWKPRSDETRFGAVLCSGINHQNEQGRHKKTAFISSIVVFNYHSEWESIKQHFLKGRRRHLINPPRNQCQQCKVCLGTESSSIPIPIPWGHPPRGQGEALALATHMWKGSCEHEREEKPAHGFLAPHDAIFGGPFELFLSMLYNLPPACPSFQDFNRKCCLVL